MNSDKNHGSLEKQLKTLGQKIRIEILKTLNNTANPVPFSYLQKEIVEINQNSTNLSFHLNSLKKIGLINSESDGWGLTTLGKKILKHIMSIEQVITEQGKMLMVRTSNYSKEPFDVQKIENYLVSEGEMDFNDAKNIARDVKTRLFKSNIEYLTTPLIREYVNGVLLEKGFEKVRHRLTRLGTPPHDIKGFLAFNQDSIIAENVLKKLGSDVSEQFMLLNLLPSNLADSYISGEIALLHLNTWWLRPLSFVVDSENILNSIKIDKLVIQNREYDTLKNMTILTGFIDIINGIMPYYSGDLLISNFNDGFLESLNSNSNQEYAFYFDLFFRQLKLLDGCFEKNNPRLIFDFSGTKFNSSLLYDEKNDGNVFRKSFAQYNHSNSYLIYDLSELEASTVEKFIGENIMFYNKKQIKPINSYIVSVNNGENQKKDIIILDKILLNFPLISNKASQDDDKFFELIQEKIDLVFTLFEYKKKFMKKVLNANKTWNNILQNYFSHVQGDWIEQSIKSISFFGLNEAIHDHCGVEMDRIERSTKFALNILDLMKKILSEKNNDIGENFVLSQPHRGKYLSPNKKNPLSSNYSARIIREDSGLQLSQKIKIFEKFQDVLNGGAIFNYGANNTLGDIEEDIKILLNSNLNAFSINGNMT